LLELLAWESGFGFWELRNENDEMRNDADDVSGFEAAAVAAAAVGAVSIDD
jgi:hypothetical protein